MDGEPLKGREPPQIPGYRLEGVLGRGATGTVYRARQISVDRLVALKVLHPELVGAKGAERRLQREARATARLAHPHIISAFDMGEVGGVWWYAMELVDGVALDARIRERPVSEREALRIFIPLVEALQHAFERGVVHRDIKPANILLSRGGRALLVDLGLAYADDDPTVTKSGATLGTPHYISPEQARDPSQADVQSDIWSLGATMYHAVCGRPPFAGESVAEILSGVLYSAIPDPADLAPQISRGLTLVIRKCLTRDRARRYQTPAELLADLERVRERRAPNVRRSALEPVAGASRTARRAAAVIALVGVACAALAWHYATRADDEPPNEAPIAGGAAADPFDDLLAAASGPAKDLGPALARAGHLARTLSAGSAAAQRANVARAQLEARLAEEIRRFQVAAEPRFDAAIDAGEFDAAEALAARGLRREFNDSVGAAVLPGELEQGLAEWLAGLGSLARSARTAAEDAFRSALDKLWAAEIRPGAARALDAGDWRTARALLTSEVRVWSGSTRLPRRGVPETVAEAALARVIESEVEPARAQLDRLWEKLDRELASWVERRATELTGAVEGRTLSDGAALLRAEWEFELARHGLTVERMPAGLLHLGHEALAKAESALLIRARELAAEDAERGLRELEEEATPLLRARRYADAAALHERALADAWRAPMRAEHELRRREARALEGLLARAARGLTERAGRTLELRLGTIVVRGRVVLSSDPLARGFTLQLDSGNSVSLALVQGAGADGAQVVGRETLEELAGLAASPEDRLLRALLCLREQDVPAARAALDAGPLPLDEPLVADAERRLREAQDAGRTAGEERRQKVQGRYNLALREGREGADPQRFARRIERLLREDADLLTADQISELRRLRDERLAEAATGGPSLDELLRPNLLEELGDGRVRLAYDLAEPRLGGFDHGSWIADREGFVALRYARSDDELLTLPGPSLVLREPVQVQNEPVDVRLRFQHGPDAPPELLLVSCAGFHVAISGPRGNKPARCYADSGDPAQVIARARAGEGREIALPKPGAAWELHVVVTRSRGLVSIEIDGRRAFDVQRPVPRGELGDRLIAVRSFEPVRLLSATIEVRAR